MGFEANARSELKYGDQGVSSIVGTIRTVPYCIQATPKAPDDLKSRFLGI